MLRDLSKIRKDFDKAKLDENDIGASPIDTFKMWLSDAIESACVEPTAMTLSTVSKDGIPSSRILLLKNISDSGDFWFYTNYGSRKGSELKDKPYAALNFFWPQLERQVRIVGMASKLKEKESDDYFNSRPKDSQLSAIISPQSQVVESREQLEKWYEEAMESNKSIKRPSNWGGYKLIPTEIEFWQGRVGRLHDRIRFKLNQGDWLKERLAP